MCSVSESILLDNLSVRYETTTVVKNVSTTISCGEPLAIIGESGSGKSSLAKALMGLSPGTVTGRILVNGQDVTTYDAKRLRAYRGKKAALVVQALGDVLNPHMKVIDQVADAMICHDTAKGTLAAEKAANLLRQWHVPEEIWKSYPKGLSGGEVQRILLAMALSNDPSFLILDEPTAALDPKTCDQVTSMIAKICISRYVLLFTHDFHVAQRLSKKLGVLYGGQLLEMGATKNVFDRPMHPYTRGLLRSSPDRSKGKDLQGVPGSFRRTSKGCPFANRCPQALFHCSQKEPPSLDLQESDGTHRRLLCHRGGIVAALSVKGLHKNYRKPVLKDVTFTVEAGETVVILGESGSGKSTLARILAGLDSPDEGVVSLDPENSGGIALVPQHPITALPSHFSIYQAVAEPLLLSRKIEQDENKKDRIAKALHSVELSGKEEFYHRRIATLSGGELQRVALARALIMKSSVLVADEATSALDVSVQAKIVRLLMTLQEQKGLAILFITHNIPLAQRVGDRTFLLEEGSLRPWRNL